MSYKYEDKLNQAAQEYINKLRQAEITAEIVPGSMREFSLKINVTKDARSFGNVVLSYSPNKEQFTPKYHEMRDRSLEPELEAVWRSNATPAETAIPATTGVEIYVDGSYMAGVIGYGAVIVTNGALIKELSDRVAAGDDPSLGEAHQVAGEIYGVKAAITWCQSQNIAQVTIAYDYAGLEQWATGGWRAKQPLTQEYVEFIQNCGVDIAWRKVAAHTGQRWNERADELAGQAALNQNKSQLEVDWVAEVKEKASGFVEYLKARGVEAEFKKVHNNQFARIQFYEQSAELGYCDIYNTKDHPLDARWNQIKNQVKRDYFKALWHEFRDSKPAVPASTTLAAVTPLVEVEYYYNILKPYTDCAFDFIDLATAIHTTATKTPQVNLNFNLEKARFDFDQLEAAYQQLRRQINGL